MKKQQAESGCALTPDALAPTVQPLLEWYARCARVLPWRENLDPYRVWVSEIMLQQTRVDAVRPYYERFLRRFPTVRQLAAAEESTLMKLWEGLGYYARARNLQKTAQLLCAQYDGVFPQELDALRALPGIGDYTAGAIASVCFGQPTPAVDGNVLRVLARLTAYEGDIAAQSCRRQAREALAAVYPPGRCGDFTQSLMELGALVCLPNGAPRCGECPLRSLCAAYQNGAQAVLPVRAAKKPRPVRQKTVLLLRCGGRLALCLRAPGGLLGGMWEFPNLDGALQREQILAWLSEQGQPVESLSPAAEKKHIFTHLEWRMTAWAVECSSPAPCFTWATRGQLESEIALPTAFRQFLTEQTQ